MRKDIKMYESHRIFRAKSLDTGEWLYGNLLDNGDSASINTPKGVDSWEGKSVDTNTVCQSTGIRHNASNSFIFEGDIIALRYEWQLDKSSNGYRLMYGEDKNEVYKLLEKEFNDKKIKYAYDKTIVDDSPYGWYSFYYRRNCFVEYDPQTGGWRLRNKDVAHRLYRDYLFNHGAYIIGNIFDSPELLKQVDNETITHIQKENFANLLTNRLLCGIIRVQNQREG